MVWVVYFQDPIPDNHIQVFITPWSSFTAFNLNINNGGDFLLPIITGEIFKNKRWNGSCLFQLELSLCSL